MKKYHDKHDFRLRDGRVMVILAFVVDLSVYFSIIASKKCRIENQRS